MRLLALLLLPMTLVGRPRVDYAFDVRMEGRQLVVGVALEVAGLPETRFEQPSSWGNASRLHRAVKRFHADGRRAHFDLVNDWEGPLREPTRHRAHLRPDHFEFNTQNALVRPVIDALSEVDARFTWKLPPGWTLATSFGPETQQRFRGRWHQVMNAVFVGGDYRLRRQDGVTLAIRGKWPFSDGEALETSAKIMRAEREFWGDGAWKEFLVTLSPFDAGESGSGGGGFHQAFSLHLPAGKALETGVLSLMAHEMFHLWNPLRMGPVQQPSRAVTWFTEGVTTLYQDIILWRAGILTRAQWLERLNQMLREDAVEKEKSPYRHGAAATLWLDAVVRQRSGGKASFDDVLRSLLSSKQERLTLERIEAAITRLAGAEPLERLRAVVRNGETVPLPARVFGACLVNEETPMFELGFDRAGLVERHRVEGLVDGSAAAEAGLRDGDLVTRTGVYWNDVRQPVRLTVKRSTESRQIEYFPHAAKRATVPQYLDGCPP